MTDMLQAIYEKGHLRLLSPVDLTEGQRVEVTITPVEEQDRLREVLGDLVAHWPDPSDDSDAYLEELADEIDRGLQGDKPLSQIIIEDRGEA